MFDSRGPEGPPAPRPAATASAGAAPAADHVAPLGPFDFKGINERLGTVGAVQTVHDTADLINSGTHSFQTFQQAQHLAANADLMGNTAMAGRFANVASRNETLATSVLENPTVKGIFDGPESLHGFGGLSAIMGGFQLGQGVQELADPKHRTQGALDTTAGALALASIAQPELAPISAAAGFIATGNDATRQMGLWGQNGQGENKDSVQWAMDNTANGWNAGRNVMSGTGSHLLTDVGGLVGGAVTGIGSGLVAGATDLGVGVGKTLWDAGTGVASFGGELLTDPGQAGRDAVNFGGQVLQGGANLVGGALNTAGNIIANPGQALQNAGNTIGNVAGNVASGALNVGGQVLGGIGQVGGALVSDAAADAGNLAQGVANVGSGVIQGAGNVVGGIAQGAGNVVGGIGNALSSLW